MPGWPSDWVCTMHMHSPFWPKVPCGICSKLPKNNLGWLTVHCTQCTMPIGFILKLNNTWASDKGILRIWRIRKERRKHAATNVWTDRSPNLTRRIFLLLYQTGFTVARMIPFLNYSKLITNIPPFSAPVTQGYFSLSFFVLIEISLFLDVAS